MIERPIIEPHLPKSSPEAESLSSDESLQLRRSAVIVGNGWRDMYSPKVRGKVTTAVRPVTIMT